MNNNKKDNPLSAYAVASHVAFTVVTPLLLFIGGGSWLADRMNWHDLTKLVFTLLGILVMIVSLISYFRRLINMYDKPEKREKPAFKSDKKDNDYFYD